MEISKRFIHFPIQLLEGFMENHKDCLNNIFRYGVYSLIQDGTVKDIEQFQEEWEFGINKEFIPSIFSDGKILFDSFSGTKFPYTGIHLSTLDKNFGPISDLQKISLLTFLALKSIIQIKPFQNTKNKLLYARMAGSPGIIDDIPESIMHWMGSRYRRDKVFLLLEKHYGLVRAYKARGISYSFTLNQEELELALLNRKHEKSRKSLTVEKRFAKQRAMEKMKEMHQSPSNGIPP